MTTSVLGMRTAGSGQFSDELLQQGASIALGKYFHRIRHRWATHAAHVEAGYREHAEWQQLKAAREAFFAEAEALAANLSPDPAAGASLLAKNVALTEQEIALRRQIDTPASAKHARGKAQTEPPNSSAQHLVTADNALNAHSELRPMHAALGVARAVASDAPLRSSGVAGPDLHTHIMGVPATDYFVQRIGGGDPVLALEKIYSALASADPKTQQAARHAQGLLRAAHDRVTAMRAEHVSAETLAELAYAGLDQALVTSDAAQFDQTYPLRTFAVEQFIDVGGGPYRNFTRDAMRIDAASGVGYVETSVGLGKLNAQDNKFPPAMMRELQAELAAEGPHLDVRFLAMVQTKALTGKVDKAAGEATKAQVREVLARGDVIGIDFAGPEKGAFTIDGMQNFAELYELVSVAATARNRALVIRPHVGEGYETGDHAHIEIARNNLEVLITQLERMGYNPAKAMSDKIIIRFGHATPMPPASSCSAWPPSALSPRPILGAMKSPNRSPRSRITRCCIICTTASRQCWGPMRLG